MKRYDTSKTSPDYEPPPGKLGTGIWLGAVVVCAAVFLGVFLWQGLGSESSAPIVQQSPAATTGALVPNSR